MVNWQLYKARMSAYGYDGSNTVESIQESMTNYFTENNPSFTHVYIDGESIGVIIIDESSITNNPNQKRIIMKPPMQINVGELVQWKNNCWLCANTDPDYPAYTAGIIIKTNKVIKWIDKNNNLIQRPSVVSAQTLYTTGMKDEKTIQIPDGMVGIQIPYDDDTKHLMRGDAFMFNKAKYVITFYNEVEIPGLLTFICQEKNINHACDDAENEIANRWDENQNDRLGENAEPPELPDDGNQYIIYGDETLRNGQVGIYRVDKFVDGIEKDSDFEFHIEDETLATISESSGNTCKVRANSKNSGTTSLIVTDLNTDITTSKTIQVVPLM